MDVELKVPRAGVELGDEGRVRVAERGGDGEARGLVVAVVGACGGRREGEQDK